MAIIELYPKFFFPHNPIPKPFINPNFNPKSKKSHQIFKPIAQFSHQPTITTSDRGIIFREKVLYLEKLKVNPEKAFKQNPYLRSCPLRTLESVEQCLASIGILRSQMGRILDWFPELLTCEPYNDIYPLLDFLLDEVGIPYHHLPKSILRCPRLLVSSVEHQLKPALCFLRELGFVGPHSLTCQTTLLLVSNVEDTLVPKVEFFMSLGFTRAEVSEMVLRSPGLLTYSVTNNLVPKLDFFLNEMNRDVAELKRFPQFFSFSLEGRIKPRHAMLVGLGLSLTLQEMLQVSNGGFDSRLLKIRFSEL